MIGKKERREGVKGLGKLLRRMEKMMGLRNEWMHFCSQSAEILYTYIFVHCIHI
jgi:hypothetical protein